MCRKAVLYVVAITLFMWCLSVPQAARAATLTVGQKSAACPKPLYLTIQSAVNAASSGDTIHVCAGTYPEQVLITKSLNLSGDNGALIEPVNVAANSTSFTSGHQSIAAIVLVQDTTGVTIQNVIVDGSGNGISECSPDLIGIFYQNASGELNHVAVRDVELSPTLNGCQSGLGIFVQSGGGGSSVVTIANSSIHDYQKNGITANEADTQVTISGNVVTGLGTAAGTAQNGIQIGFGATGTIHANTVANHVYALCIDLTGCQTTADDILVYQSDGVTVDHNTAGVSQTGIAIVADNAKVLDNTVFDSLVFDGVLLQGNGNSATGNHITRSDRAAVVISGNSNTVQQEVINDATIGILTIAGSAGNTIGINTFFNTPVQTQDPAPSATRQATPYR
jgi:nitrous oxidase accessory protein NosD